MSPPAKRLLENMRLVAPRHIYVRRREEKAALELVRQGLAVWYGVHEIGLTGWSNRTGNDQNNATQ